MPGYQEILIISAIVLGVIFIPRMMAPRKPPPRLIQHNKGLSGTWRAALVLSVVYPLAVAALMHPWKNDVWTYLYCGPGPVVLIWLIVWVVKGFKPR